MNKLIIASILMLTSIAAKAQLTILNVPSADITDKGGGYARVDGSYQPSNASSVLTPNFMFGVGHKTELNLNAEDISHPYKTQTAVMVGFKSQLFEKIDSNNEVKFSIFAGDKIGIPVTNKRSTVNNYVYLASALQSARVRLTAGAFNSQDYEARGNRTGALLGLEVNTSYSGARPTSTLAFDWQSGNGKDGYLTSGLMLFPTDRLMIIPAYSIGNRDVARGNHFAAVYVGYRFK